MRVNEPRTFRRRWWLDVRTHLDELWRHRALISALVARELASRYRGSALGYAWTLLNPLLQLAIYSLVFGLFMRVRVDDYPLFLFSALLPWMWLAASLGSATTSISGSGRLIRRTLLPPQTFPGVQVLAHMVHMLLALPVLLLVALWMGRPPGPWLALLPVLLVAQLLLTYGLAVAVAALCVHFRDIEYVVRNLVTLWFFLTPIVYPIELVPEAVRELALLNPMTPIARSYQQILYAGGAPDAFPIVLSLAFGVALLYAGISTFERMRDGLAEEV